MGFSSWLNKKSLVITCLNVLVLIKRSLMSRVWKCFRSSDEYGRRNFHRRLVGNQRGTRGNN